MKRKYEISTINYQLCSQKKHKMEDSTQSTESYQVLKSSTQFQDGVMMQLWERCLWLGLNPDVYNSLGGMSLLTVIAVRETELTKLVNLTDMQVVSLLQGQREKLKTKSKCPYRMCKFESKGTGKQKDSEVSDKEIYMSNTDQMLSLVTSQLGRSRVFPDESKIDIKEPIKKKIVE